MLNRKRARRSIEKTKVADKMHDTKPIRWQMLSLHELCPIALKDRWPLARSKKLKLTLLYQAKRAKRANRCIPNTTNRTKEL